MAENAFKADWPSFALGFNTGKSKGGGGVELNIAYGDTPPEDTSKLWVKTDKPSKVFISNMTPDGKDASTVKDREDNYGSISTNYLFRNAATVGEATYALGVRKGQSTSYDATVNEIWKFTGSSWAKLSATLPSFIEYGACVAVGTKIYLLGGSNGMSTTNPKSSIYCFDTETQTASTLSAVLPRALTYSAGAAVGTKIYIFGGYSSSTSAAVDTIYCFDTETETISTMIDKLPKSSQCMGCAAVGTKIYLFGGMNTSGSQNTIYCFDTETARIKTLAVTLETARYLIGCCAVGTDIILYGGVTTFKGGEVKELWVFDTLSNSLMKTTIRPAWCAAAIVVPFCTDHSKGCLVAGAYGVDLSKHKYGDYSYQKISSAKKITLAEAFELEANHLYINADAAIVNTTAPNWFAVNSDTAQVQVRPLFVRKGNSENLSEYVAALLYTDGAWEPV